MLRRHLLRSGWSLGGCAIAEVARPCRVDLRHAGGCFWVVALHADPTVPMEDRRVVPLRAYAQRLPLREGATYLLGDFNFAAEGGQRVDIRDVAVT